MKIQALIFTLLSASSLALAAAPTSVSDSFTVYEGRFISSTSTNGVAVYAVDICGSQVVINAGTNAASAQLQKIVALAKTNDANSMSTFVQISGQGTQADFKTSSLAEIHINSSNAVFYRYTCDTNQTYDQVLTVDTSHSPFTVDQGIMDTKQLGLFFDDDHANETFLKMAALKTHNPPRESLFPWS